MLSLTRFSSRLAQNSLNFGLVLLIVDETGKAFYSSLLVLALVIPATVAGIVAGTAADIFPKRLLIFLGDAARGALCIAFALRDGGVGAYYGVAVLLSVTSQFATAAEGSMVPLIVGRSRLARANAIGQAVGGVAQLLGFGVLTPVVLRLFHSPAILFYTTAALFFLAAVQALLIGRVRRPERLEVGGNSEGPWWLTGWRAIRADPAVFQAATELTLISTSLIILGGLIPKYISEVLDLPVDIGVIVLVPGALGVALGLRTAAFLAHRVPHGALSTFGFLGFVALLAGLTFVDAEASFLAGYGAFAWLNDVNLGNFDRGGVLAMFVVLPLGFAYAVVVVSAQTVLSDLVPLHLQGRVQATQGALAAIASSAPVLVAGALVVVIGVVPVMATLAGITGAAAVANLRRPRAPASHAPSGGR